MASQCHIDPGINTNKYVLYYLNDSSIKADYYKNLFRCYSSTDNCNSDIITSIDNDQMTSKAFVDILIKRLKDIGTYSCNEVELLSETINLNKFQTSLVNGVERLQCIVGEKTKTILPWEDSFDIVWQLHNENSHPRGKDLLEIMQDKYVINISTVECINQVCPVCLGEKSNRRCALDIIRLKNTDNEFNYIMAYQDLITGFIRLRPISADSVAQEITMELLKIFTDFGPPEKIIINNSALASAIIPLKDIISSFDVKIIFVDPDSSKNNNIEKLINEWMKANDCQNWAFGCHMLQWQLNNVSYGKYSLSPYTRVFKSLNGNIVDNLRNRKLEVKTTQENADVLMELISVPNFNEDTVTILDEVGILDEEDPLGVDETMSLQTPLSKSVEILPISPEPGPSNRSLPAMDVLSSSDSAESIPEVIDLEEDTSEDNIINKEKPISPVLAEESSSSLSDDDRRGEVVVCVACDKSVLFTYAFKCIRCEGFAHLECGEKNVEDKQARCNLCVKLDNLFC